MSVDVAIFLPSLGGGGAERVMLILANGMAERGLRVDLVLASAKGPYLKDVVTGVRVVDLGAGRVVSSLPGLLRYLRRERPQAMLSGMNYANVIAVVAKVLSGSNTRLLVIEHSSILRSHNGPQSLRGRAVPRAMRWAYRKVDGIVAVSQGVADDLALMISLPREKISVIYNPVVTHELYAKVDASLAHPWLGHGKPPVILGVGRLTRAKDFASLIRAFAIVRAQRDCRLVILGEGELRPNLEALIQELHVEDSVQLPGFVDNPYAWMARVKLFVFSSAWEGFGNVLVEAMACGTTVVSTDCPSGPGEILEGGKWGALVPVGDIAALAKSMLEVLRSPDKIDARTRVKEFGCDLIVEQYIQALFPGKITE